MICVPQCSSCIHFQAADLTGNSCTAFPEIPAEIIQNRFDHSNEWPGDNGVRFQATLTADVSKEDAVKKGTFLCGIEPGDLEKFNELHDSSGRFDFNPIGFHETGLRLTK